MVNLANLLELVAGGEPIEVIDRDTTTSIDPKKGDVFLYPFEEYEVLSVYSGIDSRYGESYMVFEVRRFKLND